jgi:hypothetical protein
MKGQSEERGGRILLLGDNRGNAAGQVPVYWSLDLDWIPLLTYTYLTISRVPTQIRLENFFTLPDLPESNLRKPGSVCSFAVIFIDLNVHCAY